MDTPLSRIVLAAFLLALGTSAAKADLFITNYNSANGFITDLNQTTGALLGYLPSGVN